MNLLAILLLAGLSAFGQGLIGEQRLQPDADEPVRQLRAPRPFRGLGLVSELHSHVRLRASADGSAWSDWREVELGHEGGSLVWFDDPVQIVEVLSAQPIRLLFIEPGTAKASLTLRRSTSSEPPVVSRTGWGCGNECTPRERPIFANVTHLVVHHSAGANESRDWAAVIRGIWVLHVQGNGWNDIGYNYLIDPNGTVYEGRAGGDGVIGAHFSGVNTGTMGVCLVGTYSTRPPTAAAMESLKRLLGWQAAKWNLDVAGQAVHAASGLSLNIVSGHRDAGLSPRASGTTECPGNGLYTYLPALRRELASTAACSIQLARRNYCLGAAASSTLVDFENPRNCEVGVEAGAPWLTVRDGRLEAAANNTSSRRTAELKIGGQWIEVSQAPAGTAGTPCVLRGGIVNAASFDTRPVALGGIVSLFGENLGREGSRTEVIVNGRFNATVFASTPNQVNFALPPGAQPGSARLEVVRDGVRGPEAMFWITEAAPAAFAAQNFDDGALNSRDTPVRAGRPLVVYLTGIGTDRRLPWEVSIGGLRAEGLYLGTTPGFLGLAQANLIVPEAIGAGEHPLQVTVSGAASPELRVAVVK